jgi:membrane-associated phospholipid phosphatase
MPNNKFANGLKKENFNPENIKEIIKKKSEPLLRLDLRKILNLQDIYTLIVMGIYTLLTISLYKYLIEPPTMIYLNVIIAITVISLAVIAVELKVGGLFKLLRFLYIVPVIYLSYSQVQLFIRAINPYFYDSILIDWDRIIFGIDPTFLMMKISNPILTEYLQIAYFLFFFLPLIHGIELYSLRKFKHLNILTRTVAFSFFLSYLLYMVMPAIGPRFTLHNFFTINQELPGIFFTNIIRAFINIGGGIPVHAIDPIQMVNRDCMPSGHTWITLVNIMLAFRFNSKFKWVFFVLGFSLIFSTIYLRYHYLVDVLVGIILAFFTIIFEPYIRRFFYNKGFTKV